MNSHVRLFNAERSTHRKKKKNLVTYSFPLTQRSSTHLRILCERFWRNMDWYFPELCDEMPRYFCHEKMVYGTWYQFYSSIGGNNLTTYKIHVDCSALSPTSACVCTLLKGKIMPWTICKNACDIDGEKNEKHYTALFSWHSLPWAVFHVALFSLSAEVPHGFRFERGQASETENKLLYAQAATQLIS